MNSPTAQQVKQARKDAGLSRREFGALVGAAYRTVQNWELGINRMSPAVWELVKIRLNS